MVKYSLFTPLAVKQVVELLTFLAKRSKKERKKKEKIL